VLVKRDNSSRSDAPPAKYFPIETYWLREFLISATQNRNSLTNAPATGF
jgi:hypothetical protein